MKRQLILLVLLSISIFKVGAIQAHTPEQVVIAFQYDYKIWNDQSFQQSQSSETKDTTLLAQKSWNELLKNTQNQILRESLLLLDLNHFMTLNRKKL